MYIVITGYEVKDNGTENGVRDFSVSIIHIGKTVKGDKYTFKRVYMEDGTYYYPRISENQLWKKGELYWKSCELTGSYDGTDKNTKMSLLSVYQRDIIPDIEEKHAEIYESGSFKVAAEKQEDSDRPHQDSVYLRDISEEFR